MNYKSWTFQNIPKKRKHKRQTKEIISKVDNSVCVYPFSETQNNIMHLNLNIFKTKPCFFEQVHNKIKCPYYHNINKDFRRNPSQYQYSSFNCNLNGANGRSCPNKNNCKCCHNSVELNYHPKNYKKRFCIYFPDNIEKCKFGDYCSYAHSENDILVDLLHNYDFDEDFFMFHYKTNYCPINHIKHDKSLCVYAHNWQDYRRKPHKYYIQLENCKQWDNSKLVLNYEEGCPQGLGCRFTHGWKEPEYHPFIYKTKECGYPKEECPRMEACPYYHNLEERRIVTEQDRRFFEFIPRGRVSQGTFKVFLDKNMYGITSENLYNNTKNDENKYQSLMISMTSLNLYPVKGAKSLQFLSSVKGKKNNQNARNIQYIHEMIADDYDDDDDEEEETNTRLIGKLDERKDGKVPFVELKKENEMLCANTSHIKISKERRRRH